MTDPQLCSKYKFKYQPEILIFVGTYGPWYQFEKDDRPGKVWCELLKSDLSMIEKVGKELEK